jgi:hypothetical protein
MRGSPRTRISIEILVLAVLTMAACESPRAAIPVVANPEWRASLVGQWHGEYASPATGRSGSIVLYLAEGEDHAHGDVLMIPRGGSDLYQLLTIRFVRAKGRQISGMLDRYWDPDCNCEVKTSFTGEINGDKIEGTFTSISGRSGVGRSTGWWEVTRKKSPSS